MGTINDFFIKHGTEGFRRLAERAGTKVSYLLQLNYMPSKVPSVRMAQRLIAASDGELTLEGLANPQKRLAREVRRQQAAEAQG